jgi:hypothetical protein
MGILGRSAAKVQGRTVSVNKGALYITAHTCIEERPCLNSAAARQAERGVLKVVFVQLFDSLGPPADFIDCF